jgi:hypothetical protein
MDTVLGPDPVIEYYKQFVDRAKLRENLKLSVDERLARLQEKAMLADRMPRKPVGPDRPWKPVSDCGPNRTTDPIIELYKRDVDRTLLRENLKLSPEERLRKLTDFMHFAAEMRAAGTRSRETA